MRYHSIDIQASNQAAPPIRAKAMRQLRQLSPPSPAETLRNLGYTYDRRLDLWLLEPLPAYCVRDGQIHRVSAVHAAHQEDSHAS